jgi:hypothetical protein
MSRRKRIILYPNKREVEFDFPEKFVRCQFIFPEISVRCPKIYIVDDDYPFII